MKRFMVLALLALQTSILGALAQLELPSSPWLPPDSAQGAEATSGDDYPNPQWSTLLGNLLYFYEAQRSGELPSTNRVSWRNSSALDDGREARVDLTGGYYDAGDFSKQTFPLSFSLMSICWGATDFGKGYDLANQTVYLDDMLRWGLDWLIKAHANESTLYVLVDNKDIGNTYWGGDRSIPSPRPVYQINDTHPGTDVAAQASAAFAACSNLYAGRGLDNNTFSTPASLQDTDYANTLLDHAEQLYSFALNATGGRKVYQKSVPDAAKAYESSGFGDELAAAALFLSWANRDSAHFADAEEYYTRYKLADYNRVFNWDSKVPGLSILYAQIAKSFPSTGSNLSYWQEVAETYFDNIIDKKKPSTRTAGGLVWWDGDSNFASLNPALNLAMLMRRYAPLASNDDKKKKYLEFSQTQVDYALGKNPMSMPYIVGVNPNSPQNPHSAMASGGNDVETIDTYPNKTAYVLYGAVVGGPDIRDRFYDIRSDWPQTEVALDYNAPLLTLTAMHVVAGTEDPFYTSLKEGAYEKVKPDGLPCDAAIEEGCKGPKLSKKAQIAMGVTLTIVCLVVFGLSGYWIWLVQRRKNTTIYTY
ncbi:9 glycosyl hydrolase [Coprinopsis cinerea okayama7|uniref:Endoglucanase n=1 Tax=Coprinopsis cinerea (strain Okayama-7 / 130 / ATCC MYA-4618 / FGSC 9003) TaxID=240176 RepID=A8NXY1_COPC7|nr:9 glycosyl hydrolase [Coprinopsis cinerea okayama7\|eukprot:XP_001837301.1 9 glycosyl hydrolase [Coprinopsis cinerea okayama7\